MQYIGIARTDQKGIIQVGVRPEILEEMLAGTQTSVVLKEFDFGKTGYVFAIDKDSKKILAHKNDKLIGEDAVKSGFPSDLKAGEGSGKIDGISKETLDNSKTISIGTEEQENAVIDLNKIMNHLSSELTKNSESSLEIAHTTQATVQKMLETKDKMELLENSITDIANTSMKIESIIEEINSIAEQTAQKLANESERLQEMID